MEGNVLSLYELNNQVRGTVERALNGPYWVQAELSDVRENSNGHCYVEFIQKDSRGRSIIAKARGTVWANIYKLLRPYFERETGQLFAAGIKVLVQVRVEFHELYGYSLTVVDIEPSYTVGDMVRHRREILRRLEEEGVIALNKELSLPSIPRRIAVISSPTAAGYGDFCNQLSENPYGFRFAPVLFPAVMQGNKVEESIIAALDKIYASFGDWDVVVIIRGGGAVSDLSGFDSYLLAANCAQFPLPIITGIGHERDDTVLDVVAHTRVKTPTAAAELLINRMHEMALRLDDVAAYIHNYMQTCLDNERYRLREIVHRIPGILTMWRLQEEQRIGRLETRMEKGVQAGLKERQLQLQLMQQRVDGCDIQKLLARGFTLTLKDGKIVTDAALLQVGDSIVTRFACGEAVSVVANKK